MIAVSLALSAATFGQAGAQERGCDAVRISAFSGEVTVRTAENRRIDARRDLGLCPGDTVATGANGGVTLYFTEKDSALTLDNDAELTIPGDRRSDATLLAGIVRLVSSVRTNFTIDSDYVTAGIDGTEATLHAVPGVGAVVAVLEGVVTARRGASSVALPENHVSYAAAAGGLADVTGADPADLPAVFRPYVVNPAGAADWAVYFPPALLAAGAAGGEAEAARLISAGDFAEADALLGCPRPAGSAAAALCAMSAVALNDRARIRAYADAPLGPDAAGEVAQSYVFQALGRLPEARDAAARAVAAAPGDGPLAAHAKARLAETELILGNRAASLAAAREAAAAGAPLGRAMLGFAELANADFDAAEAEFDAAIDAGDQAPLPLLGRGLAKIRQGDLAGGRRDLETAVALDPNRADLRVWLGRAYYEEGLPEKARAQFDMARARDPDDPNAWFFSALERYAANDPVGALRDVREAEARGEGRSVLRSEGGLGEDSAVRGAALGRIYNTLGFETLGQRAGAAAVDRDPTNPEAHRFLADVYRTRKGFEIAQTSEQLKADLLAPPSKAPLQPQLGEAQIGLLQTTGPTASTFSEFAPLFDSNGVQFYGTLAAGTQDTYGQEASVSILHDNFSIAFGGFHYDTEGYRENNQIDYRVGAVQVKYQPSPWLTLFGEYRRFDAEMGNRVLGFFLDQNFNESTTDFARDSGRIGFRADALGGTILGLGTWANFDTKFVDPQFFGDFLFANFFAATSEEFLGGELQYIGQQMGVDFTVGMTASTVDGLGSEEFAPVFFPGPGPTFEDQDHDQASGYAYASFDWPMNLRWTFGGSVEHFDDDVFGSDTRFHPKAGVAAKLSDMFTLRAAYTSATKRKLVLDQTLEPTTVAGFNQFFDTFNGARIDQAAVGVDAEVSSNLHLGAEAAMRWYDWPQGDIDEDLEEQSYRIYGGFLPTDRIAVSGEAVYERVDSPGSDTFQEIDSFSAPLRVRYFDPSGVFAGAGLTFVHQEYTDNNGVERDDDAFLVDLALGYRLPNRAGVASIEVLNLFDESFNYQERSLSPQSINAPTFARERTIVGRLTVSF